MRELGFSVVRMAEFAWSIFEPVEGEFHFNLFDRAINLAHKHGLHVILGTPSATPPAWLTSKYPEVLNVSQTGVVYQHGQRRHYNYNAPIYRELSVRVARQMAGHYKEHPAVMGWQIDNELNCEMNVFYSDADHLAFRTWLQKKYGTLECLNSAWGTVFWNQTYSSWDQVYLTRPTVSNSPNPHQALDEKRFFSDSAISFCRLQAEEVRRIVPSHHWITTNGIFGHLDNHKLTRDSLDFLSYDSYPNVSSILPDSGDRPLLDRKWSWNLSVVRSVSPNFCVMEQQTGPCGWFNRLETPSPKPGQMRLWTYQSIAHGTDMLLYFRWRTAVFGMEMYWHGINDYHNQSNRRMQEMEQIGEELGRLGRRIVGSRYQAEAAIVKDYCNDWDGELDNWHGPLEKQSVLEWFKSFQRKHIPVDALFMTEDTAVEDLLPYKLLVYPHPTIMPPARAELLKEYVRQGGTVIFGCRSGYKNEYGQCYMQPLPGPLAELCGVEVADFTLIGTNQQPPQVSLGDQEQITSKGFNDILRVTRGSAEVLARYTDDYYKDSPALVRNRYGEGTVYYYGSAFTEESANKLLELTNLRSPVSGIIELPEQVELSVRRNAQTGESLLFLMNYSSSPQEIRIHEEKRELISGKRINGTIWMEAFEVYVMV